MFINNESSLDEHVFALFFFTDSEKSLYSFLLEVYNYNENYFMSALEISLSTLFDIHVEYINKRRYLTETKNGFRKESLITMLDDSRWENFRYSFEPKREGVELGLDNNMFRLLKHVRALGGYKSYADTLFVAMRIMCILSVQNGRGIPVNVFYKLYKPQRSQYKESNGYVYEDITEQIKEIGGMVTFH